MHYLVFYGTAKTGGWNDFFKTFPTLQEARDKLEEIQEQYPEELTWAHIVVADGKGHYTWVETIEKTRETT